MEGRRQKEEGRNGRQNNNNGRRKTELEQDECRIKDKGRRMNNEILQLFCLLPSIVRLRLTVPLLEVRIQRLLE